MQTSRQLINPQHACAVRVTVVGPVCLSVCLSVNQHLTSGVPFRPENIITYSTGNKVKKNCVDFSETVQLQRYTTSCIVWLSMQSAILETTHVHY